MASPFTRIYGLQLLFGLMLVFGWSFAMLHFLNLGFTYLELMVYNFLTYLTAVVIIIGLKKIYVYGSIKIAVYLFIAIFILLINLDSTLELYIISMLAGATIPFFWLPVNIVFFRMRSSDNVALFSSLALFFGPSISTIVPYFSGIVISRYGYPTVFGISIILLGLTLSYIKKIEERIVVDLQFTHAVKACGKLKLVIAVEGFWQGVNMIVFPLYTFYFITESMSYGAFLSYVGFAGALASLLLARISDKSKKRFVFVTSTVFFTAILTIISGFASGYHGWVISRTLLGFAISLYSPFALALVLDNVSSTRKAMVARELFLNIGRLIGGAFVLLMYYVFHSLQSTLIVAGAVFMIYPLIVSKKRLCAS